MYRRRLLAAPILAAPVFVSGAVPGVVLGQSLFGSRPIRMIVPVAVAGASDIVARIIADAMTPLLGRTIVAENIAGAGSTLGANAFQQTPADGQTIYVCTNNHALMKLIYPRFAYDPAADFVPIALLTRQAFVLAVHSSVPANSVPELIAWLRQRGAEANCGAAAPGAANYMAAELLRLRAGVDFTIVPYRAAATAVQDLAEGRLDFTVDSPTLVMPMVRQGKLRALAVTIAGGSTLLPGLPGLQEAGVPDYDNAVWTMMFARPGTPEPTLATLRDAAARALADPPVRQRLATVGFETWPDASPAATEKLLRSEIARWTPIVARLNLKPS
jgi:tripartite-type tricarboxylate transporter receptor subunit TctC